MSHANPTPLRIGARGTLHGWRTRVAGRLVLGVEIDGETYYWNEFHLIGDNATPAPSFSRRPSTGPNGNCSASFSQSAR